MAEHATRRSTMVQNSRWYQPKQITRLFGTHQNNKITSEKLTSIIATKQLSGIENNVTN